MLRGAEVRQAEPDPEVLDEGVPWVFSTSQSKKGKDPNAPKRPMSAYMLWLNASREKIKSDHPGISITDLSKKAGELWKAMSKEKKEVRDGRPRAGLGLVQEGRLDMEDPSLFLGAWSCTDGELGRGGDILGLVSWVIRGGSRVRCRWVLEDGGGGEGALLTLCSGCRSGIGRRKMPGGTMRKP